MRGFLRSDGRKGIRNTLLVCYTVECAHHVARKIVDRCDHPDVQLIGFPGCYPNDHADRLLRALTTHPNVGAVLLISLGCEGLNAKALHKHTVDSGRSCHLLSIQSEGGTATTIAHGVEWAKTTLDQLANQPTTTLNMDELVIGTICGGSDSTSGITANPAIGRAFDRLIKEGSTCIFEETGELIGCEGVMQERAKTPEVARDILNAVNKAAAYYTVLGHGSFAPGNAEGGLTTQEEKSLGAYAKSGDSPITGVIYPAQHPKRSGLYLLDVVPDGEVRFGFPNIADSAEIIELISCGAQIILFSTGRGSVVGSAISPVIKVCANPETYQRMSHDMDINAGKILTGEASVDDVGDDLFNLVLSIANGEKTLSEALGHNEYLLTYKYFDTKTQCS